MPRRKSKQKWPTVPQKAVFFLVVPTDARYRRPVSSASWTDEANRFSFLAAFILDTEHLPNRLPLRCHPIEGETLNSFIVRLAHRNFVERPADLVVGILDTFPKGYATEPELRRLSALSGEPVDVLRRLSPPYPKWGSGTPVEFMGQKLRVSDFYSRRRACPACLAESPHETQLSQVWSVIGCVDHGLAFISRCSCGRPLGYETNRLDRCWCGQNISQLPTTEWPTELRDLSRYVLGRLHGIPGPSVPRLDREELGEALCLIEWVGELGIHETGPWWESLDFQGTVGLRGFKALSGPDADLLRLVRDFGARYPGRRRGRVRLGQLQPDLPGLEPPGYEKIGALVREAAAA